MSKKPASKKNAQQQEQEHIALSNIFNTFLLGLAAECYLFIVYRGYIAGTINSLLTWDKILHVLLWVGVAALVGGCGLALVKKSDDKLRRRGLMAALGGAFFALSGWVMTTFFDTGVIAMCTIVPVLTVLTLIYFLYQRECFASTVLLSGALFTVWVCGKGLSGMWQTCVMICTIAVLVALAVIALLARKMQKNGGKLGRWNLLPADMDWRVLYLVIAVSALLVVLGLVAPFVSYYLIWGAVIALFAEIGYYTTKLM